MIERIKVAFWAWWSILRTGQLPTDAAFWLLLQPLEEARSDLPLVLPDKVQEEYGGPTVLVLQTRLGNPEKKIVYSGAHAGVGRRIHETARHNTSVLSSYLYVQGVRRGHWDRHTEM